MAGMNNRITKADREVFERQPGRKCYVRLATQAEVREWQMKHPDDIMDLPRHAWIFMAFQQVRPGVLLRTFIFGSPIPMTDEVSSRLILDPIIDEAEEAAKRISINR